MLSTPLITKMPQIQQEDAHADFALPEQPAHSRAQISGGTADQLKPKVITPNQHRAPAMVKPTQAQGQPARQPYRSPVNHPLHRTGHEFQVVVGAITNQTLQQVCANAARRGPSR